MKIKLVKKWWFPAAVAVAALYELCHLGKMSDAKVERISLWIVDHAMTMVIA